MGARAAARRTPPAPTVARYQLSPAVSRPGRERSAMLRSWSTGRCIHSRKFVQPSRDSQSSATVGLEEEHVPAHLLLLEAAGGEERGRVADGDRAELLDPVGRERRDEPRDRRAPVVADDRRLLDAERVEHADRVHRDRSGSRTRRRLPARRTRRSRAGRSRSRGSRPRPAPRSRPARCTRSRESRGARARGGRPPAPRR